MELPTPQSRSEQYLNVLATGEGELPLKPKSRTEKILNAIITGNEEGVDNPVSRIEKYLYHILKNGGIGGGASAPSKLVLYDYGNQCEDITGGWVQGCYTGGSFDVLEKCIEFSDTDANTTGGICTTNRIDLTNYKSIKLCWQPYNLNFEGKLGTAYIYVRIGKADDLASLTNICEFKYGSSSGGSHPAKEDVIDISQYEGEYYISMAIVMTKYTYQHFHIRLHYMCLEK